MSPHNSMQMGYSGPFKRTVLWVTTAVQINCPIIEFLNNFHGHFAKLQGTWEMNRDID